MPIQVQHGTYKLPAAEPELAYTIYMPDADGPPHAATISKLALVAHPLGRLGGNRNDHVVKSIALSLASENFVVLAYDSRGAGESTGSPSFSLVPESEDYSVMLHKVLLPIATTKSTASPPAKPLSSLSLALVGYSAGSAASTMTDVDLDVVCNCMPSLERVSVTRVLVSYPLSVMWALTLFRSTAFSSKLERNVTVSSSANAESTKIQLRDQTLAVYGTNDQFTSVARYDAWSNRLKQQSQNSNKWNDLRVDGADHFWRDKACKGRLLGAIEQFCGRGE
ncbi:hypothetical protein OIV83_002395 [Microbotryomycetes sp. JL201]|nr:hypothetical protein OIV83_002395 [Microbotryomycetes sp. JL201]